MFLAHSMTQYNRAASVVWLSVRRSASVNFLAQIASTTTKMARCAQGQGQGQRSRDTGTFVPGTKIASSPRQMDGLRPNLHTMISRGRMHN